MGRGYKNFQTVISIRACIRMENFLDMANIFGRMEPILRVPIKMEGVMVMVFGKEIQETVISMRDNIKMIKKMGTGFSHGQMETLIKGTIRMTSETGMGRFIGMMVVFIKEVSKMGKCME